MNTTEIESKKEISNEKVEQKEKRIQGLFEYINKGYKDYKDYKNLVKKENIIFENYFKNKDSLINNFESFNDNLQKVIIKSKANKLKRKSLEELISNRLKRIELSKYSLKIYNV